MGSGHNGRYGSIHLHGRLQFLAGEIYRHQREAGGAVLPHAHGQHVKGHRRRDLPGRQAGPENTVRRDGYRVSRVIKAGIQGAIRPQKRIGHQRSKAVVLLYGRCGCHQIIVRAGQHLIVGQVIAS